MLRVIKRAPWIALGAAAVWFFDPAHGADRRQEARHRLGDFSAKPEG